MLSRVEIKNFGPLDAVLWENLSAVNLIIGENGSGKTFLLKSLYTAVKTIEEYKRGKERRSGGEILSDKLYWTFQTEKIGDLVTKNAEGPLSFSIIFDDKDFSYTFGKDTTKQISQITINIPPRENNSIFLPAKEVLSLHNIILQSREQDKVFGFDDTYLDLARALRHPIKGGKNYATFAVLRQDLEKILGGRVEYDDEKRAWQFKKGNQRFSMGVTAEGVKKIAIIDTLLGNKYLDARSIIFIDEPESALHPTAVSHFLNIIYALSRIGIQFFIASHSYFVIKKLALLARGHDFSIPVFVSEQGRWTGGDLRDEMPDNEIINESIRLYRKEIGLVL